MSLSLRVLAVCTHNRTRSVLVGALFEQFARRRGIDTIVRTAGFAEGGMPPTDTTVKLLAKRGIDASGHQSHLLTENSVIGADLVITAEHEHVVAIAGRWPQAFGYTFTLPELVERGDEVGQRGDRTLQEWLTAVNIDRPTALDYLETPVDEIDDPTGLAPSAWATCLSRVDALTSHLAILLA